MSSLVILAAEFFRYRAEKHKTNATKNPTPRLPSAHVINVQYKHGARN